MAFLLAVDAAEADTFSMVAVQDFERVAVENGDDGAGEICCDSGTGEAQVVYMGYDQVGPPITVYIRDGYRSRLIVP